MAKTTATVTVGADTSPFERKMRTLGRGLAGGVTTGVSRVGGMAMSGLGAGLGFGLSQLGLDGIGSMFQKLREVSPQLNAAITKLTVAFGDALAPAADKLAEVFERLLPSVLTGLELFGNALADAIQFWTEDAFNPMVWQDIGKAITEVVKDAIKEGVTLAVGDEKGAPSLARRVEQAAIEDDMPPWMARIIGGHFSLQLIGGNLFTSPFATREGPDSL